MVDKKFNKANSSATTKEDDTMLETRFKKDPESGKFTFIPAGREHIREVREGLEDPEVENAPYVTNDPIGYLAKSVTRMTLLSDELEIII